MPKVSKRYTAAAGKVEDRTYTPQEAVELVKANATAKFDETVEAHARLGQMAEGRRIFRQALQAANHVGLMAEHWDPQSGTAHGNFPQCYSHVGLIGAAFALSPTAPLLG